ncbi:MAG: flagellar biosynthetic protein FliR [Burkholderiales bacterium]|nr:flagellar biosynthetic protein FliR [Burkholderiales bacterium]
MLTFTYEQLAAWLAGFLWPLARVAALIGTAPILGDAGVSRRIKAAAAVGVTLALAPLVASVPAADPWSGPGLVALAGEMLIGAAMGFTLRLVFAMVDVAGEVTGLQMGLGFATFYDPLHGTQTPMVAQFLGLLASLVFLSMNGHLMMLVALAESFRLLPVGAAGGGAPAALALAQAGAGIFVSGLMLALPVIAAILITNVALGILTRAAPQLNLFAVGFPAMILVGWLALTLALPLAAPFLTRAFEEGLAAMLAPLR